jgi:hypothetical protein
MEDTARDGTRPAHFRLRFESPKTNSVAAEVQTHLQAVPERDVSGGVAVAAHSPTTADTSARSCGYSSFLILYLT